MPAPTVSRTSIQNLVDAIDKDRHKPIQVYKFHKGRVFYDKPYEADTTFPWDFDNDRFA